MSFLGMHARTGVRQRWRSWLALIAARRAGRRPRARRRPDGAAHGHCLVHASRPRTASTPSPTPRPRFPTSPPCRAWRRPSRSARRQPGPPACDSCTGQINGNYFSIEEVAPAQLTHLVKLVSGHMPDQSDPGQVLASESLAPLGVHVGTVLRVRLATSAQRAAVLSNATMTPLGPTVTLHVVGHGDLGIRVPVQLHAGL